MLLDIQKLVKQAGGEWIGIQDAFPGDLLAKPKIVFRHPYTHKVVLIPFNPYIVTEDELRKEIQDTIADGNPPDLTHVVVEIGFLRQLAETISNASKELNALCAGEKKQ